MRSRRCGLSMARRERRGRREYACQYPPCIHVVYDDRRKLFKVFIEYDYDGGQTIVVSIDSGMLANACSVLRFVRENGFREAEDTDIDYLARKYLNISRILENKE